MGPRHHRNLVPSTPAVALRLRVCPSSCSPNAVLPRLPQQYPSDPALSPRLSRHTTATPHYDESPKNRNDDLNFEASSDRIQTFIQGAPMTSLPAFFNCQLVNNRERLLSCAQLRSRGALGAVPDYHGLTLA